ncbi:MAG: tRNA pseudouridine(55) synthase TruB [Alphaproteobacteria bacterium]|nr:MAG: tRNA pseudouridine(55) synthase TruB [Alphaproteobacteria bacterium]
MNHLSGIGVLNKPIHCTSMDLIRQIKRKLNYKGKIGHAGTLDPMASGVIPIVFGEATKFVNFFHDQIKEYIFKVEFGKFTDSYDSEGVLTQVSDVIPSEIELAEAIKLFQGDILQIPPAYSACKVAGKRAYDLARKGIEINLEPKKIKIHEFELICYDAPFVQFRVKCGSGTYVRSLAIDVAKRVGAICYVTEIIRTQYWQFKLLDSLNIDNFNENRVIALENIAWSNILELTDLEYSYLKHGRQLETIYDNGSYIGFYNGSVVGILIVDKGILFSQRMLKS